MNRLKKIVFMLLLPFMALIVGYGVYKLFLIPPPEVKGLEALSLLPAKKEVVLQTYNIRKLEITIMQGTRRYLLFKREYERPPERISLVVEPGKLGLQDGHATVVVHMSSGILKKKERVIDTLVDTVPPELHVLYAPFSLKTGESGPVILKVKEAERAYVRLNGNTYNLFPFPRGYYAGLIPVGIKGDGVFYAVAEDRAGNTTVQALRTRIKKVRFKSASINITEDFVKKVILPLLGKTESSDPVSDFRRINEEWRKRDEEHLRQIGKRSSEVFYLRGRFLQLKNSKVMSVYGEHRRYLYKGRVISESYHLGYDLASVANAPVGAANRGRIVFAGNLGIYGNTVIIDHGLGLMSLYGHLSEVLVREGEVVKKGQVIGRTGQTGLAGGDHLHFSILVQGEEVSPLYWWDARWVRVHITEPLNTIPGG